MHTKKNLPLLSYKRVSLYIVIPLILTFYLVSNAQESDKHSSDNNDGKTNQGKEIYIPASFPVSGFGIVSGPTGLFSIYNTDILEKNSFSFSTAMDTSKSLPSAHNIQRVPFSGNFGVLDKFELFFSADLFRRFEISNIQTGGNPLEVQYTGRQNKYEVGAKIRFSKPGSRFSFGFIPFYQYNTDVDSSLNFKKPLLENRKADNYGDWGIIGIEQATIGNILNISLNNAYINRSNLNLNSSNRSFQVIHRPDEFHYGIGLDLNLIYSQPIIEFQGVTYINRVSPYPFNKNQYNLIIGTKRAFINKGAKINNIGISFGYSIRLNGNTNTNRNNGFSPIAFQNFNTSRHGITLQISFGNSRRFSTPEFPPEDSPSSETITSAISPPCPAGMIPVGNCDAKTTISAKVSFNSLTHPEKRFEFDPTRFAYFYDKSEYVQIKGDNFIWDLSALLNNRKIGENQIILNQYIKQRDILNPGEYCCERTKTFVINLVDCNCNGGLICPGNLVIETTPVSHLGDQAVYRFRASNIPDDPNIKYNWKLTDDLPYNKINATTIVVNTKGLEGRSLKATVEIESNRLDPACPKTANAVIDVPICPENIVIETEKAEINKGEKAIFNAKVSGIDEKLISNYSWVVENGAIEKGDGTRSIVVLPIDSIDKVKATVRVQGKNIFTDCINGSATVSVKNNVTGNPPPSSICLQDFKINYTNPTEEESPIIVTASFIGMPVNQPYKIDWQVISGNRTIRYDEQADPNTIAIPTNNMYLQTLHITAKVTGIDNFDPSCLSFAENYLASIFFETSKYRILPTEEGKLAEVISWFTMYNNGRLEVYIEGNADIRHTDSYNNTLALNRAKATITYIFNILKTKGIFIKPEQIIVKGFGRERAKQLNHKEKGYWKFDRRVDIRFIPGN